MNISVFITSYNQKNFLEEAIESVLDQTLKPSQIIIVDDCSIDGSRDMIEGYRSRYPDLITPILHERNTGVAQVRIDALNAVTGDYVTYVDGDDRFLPTKLEKEASVLKDNPHVQIAYSNNYYMTEDGTHTGMWIESERPPEGDVFRATFSRDFPRSSLFRMELVEYNAWEEVGFHDPNLFIYEDYDMRIRLTKQLRVKYHNEPLSEIRTHGAGLSKSVITKHIEAFKYIYKKNNQLLSDLPVGDKKHLNNKFKANIASLARAGVQKSLEDGNRKEAFRLFMEALKYKALFSDTLLFAKLVLT